MILMAEEQFKHIVRIANTDLDGNKSVVYALTGIKGIGFRVAQALVNVSGIKGKEKLGNLPNDQIQKIKELIEENLENAVPTWMLNRRRDLYTGEDFHLLGNELDMSYKEDIDLLRKIRAYRGIRHEKGKKVRGQRTRSTGRKGVTVGVIRRKK